MDMPLNPPSVTSPASVPPGLLATSADATASDRLFAAVWNICATCRFSGVQRFYYTLWDQLRPFAGPFKGPAPIPSRRAFAAELDRG
jgi:hypothetical protein